jgi:hypothetical protein
MSAIKKTDSIQAYRVPGQFRPQQQTSLLAEHHAQSRFSFLLLCSFPATKKKREVPEGQKSQSFFLTNKFFHLFVIQLLNLFCCDFQQQN